ncbi:MerR family transcriptional regulator [Bacillus manliponensis]|uniref:MerR family transcriptional regulator n=1 Tax=Bacillus manliponensis TaxID=574376 RepID=UPI003516D9E2
MRMISIQQLTKETGVTVRTLRYYDERGLLKPSGKTEGGHRLYSEQDVMKLQQILFLKEMGFPLREIIHMFTVNDWDLKSTLQKQLSFVQEEQKKFQRMEKMLQAVVYSAEIEGELEWNVMFGLIQLSRQSSHKRELFQKQLFSEEEQQFLKRLPNMSEASDDVKEWIVLLKEMRTLMQARKSIDDIAVQTVTGKIMKKCNEMADGDEEFLEKLWEVRKSKEQSQQMNMYPIEDELLVYMDEAFAFYIEKMEGKR